MSGGLVRALAAAAAVLAVALPFSGGIERPGVLAAALLLTGVVLAALGVITGMWAETFDQHAFVAGVVVAPLALLAGVFYSPLDLAEPWRTLTRVDPITYLVDAARAGSTGIHESPLALSLPIAAAVAVGLCGVATALLARGWRLKP